MKKLFKAFIYLIITIISLVIILAVVAKLAENKISEIALKKVSENIKAPVKIEEVSFNLIRKFPLATIELNRVVLGAEQNNNDSLLLDTIASIQKIYVSVKSKPLLKSIIDIEKVDLEGAHINYLVDTSGSSNIDFLLKPSEAETTDTAAGEPLDLTLSSLSVKNLICNFNDRTLKVKSKIQIPELKVKASMKNDKIAADAKGLINISKSDFSGTNLYLMKNTNIGFDINYSDSLIKINEIGIETDGAKLNLTGNLIYTEKIFTDIQFTGSDFILNELIKYAPKELLNDFGLKKVAGTMNISGKINGTVSDNELPQVDLIVAFNDGHIITADYPELKNIRFKGKISNGILRNNQSTQADFEAFHFETHKSKFDFAFSVLDIDHLKYNIRANLDVDVEEFKPFIPDTLLESVNGKIKVQFSTKGMLPDSINEKFIDDAMANSKAQIEFKNLNAKVDPLLIVKNFSSHITYKPNNIAVEKLNVDIPSYNIELKNTSLNADFWGSINNLQELKINLKSYHIETKGSTVSGNAKVKNLENPDYEFESKIITNLAEAKEMLPDSVLKTLSGNVELNVRSKATLKMDSLEFQMMEIVFKNSSYNMKMNKVSAELFDMPLYTLENVSGLIDMSPETISINKMSGIAAGIDFEIDSTEIRNTYETFIQERKDKIFTLQTNVILGEINNALIGAFMPDTTATSPPASNTVADNTEQNTGAEVSDSVKSNYLLPDLSKLGIPHFLVRGKLAIKKLEYEKNNVDDFSMKFRFADSLYVVDELTFKTCGGELNTSFMLDARKWEEPKIDLKNYITNLNVKELLMRNDNFGDTSLTYEKVNGILTSEIHARAFYVNGSWPTERVRAEGHFTLEDGHIYGYEPLVELSKNKILGGLKELDKLDFNTLNTSVFVFKDKIFIPKTNVVTSSMDMSAFAMHDLKGDYEYHIELHLKDVLAGKSEKLMKEQAKQNKKDGTTVEREGLKLYSLKYGDKSKTWFDNPDLIKEFLKDLNRQKGFLRIAFRPLLVNYSTELDRTSKFKDILDNKQEE